MNQLALPLEYRAALGVADFFVSDANREAVRYLDRWRSWQVPVALLLGPPASGKSHLARIWERRSGGTVLDGLGDMSDREALFHAWNAAAPGRPLLLVARQDPDHWARGLADLASRLAATPRAVIASPDDALLAAVMRKRFRDLGVEVSADVVRFALARIERSMAAVIELVDQLESAALAARRPVTVPLARDVLMRQERMF
ncbi:MAG: chromosomal replication initiator DnaA [Sphingomonadaceae bacterium]|nr:chromosomal replication initiator DnaA [Sphingomonadaceae bacterium]